METLHSTIKGMGNTTGESLARHLAARLKASGFQAWFVGGCVRDLLLGVPPQDFDVATDALPEQVSVLFPGSQLVGAHFGVVLVCRDNAHVEVATFRSDHTYEDGRRPLDVTFEKDPRQDVLRRDFTINALLQDPASGEILDFVDGRKDLANGVVRAIGDPEVRFREDHLRLLRAVRFAARFGFEIEGGTKEAIGRLHPLIAKVSAERVRDELVRILTEGGARRGFELLDETGLLQEILPEVAAMKGVAQPPPYHPEGDVWTHTLMLLDNLRQPTPTLALAALLHDVGKPPTFRIADRIRFDGHAEVGAGMAAGIMARLRFSHDEISQVESDVRHHMRFMDVPRMKDSALKRFLRLPHFDELLELHRLDCVASHGHLDNYQLVTAKLTELPPEQIRPTMLINGQDLIESGYAPGPIFKEILTFVEDAQLEGTLHDRDEALALVRSRFPLSGTVIGE
jgi:putative nucleotidyltransferase with HDIG domain